MPESSENTMPEWLLALAAEGRRQEVAGNTPLWLDAPNSVWLIRAGWIDVFAVPSLPDGDPVARHHLFRLGVGGLLCGVVDDGQERPRLLAVGGPGSEVVELRREQLAKLETAELESLLSGWIRGMIESAVLRRADGKVTRLEPGEVRLEPEQVASPGQQTVWARHVKGASRFLGKPELTLRDEHGFLPFAGASWLVADSDGAHLEVVTTHNLPNAREWTALLDRFHHVILACTALNLSEAKQEDRIRLEQRAASEERLTATTLSRLAHVDRPEIDESTEAGGQDPLLEACRHVCGRLGVTARAPQLVGQSKKHSEPIMAIARASRVRVRRVALKGDWWRRDNGPLVAYVTENGQPVALLSKSPTRYEIVDPKTEKHAPLTSTVARTLQPFAHSFYRPFAAKSLTMWQILRYALKGSGRDWITIGLMGLAGSLLGLVTPVVTGWIFDWIIPGGQSSQLLLVVLGLITTALATAIFQVTSSIASLRVQTRMDSEAQAAVWDRLLDLPAPFFRRFTAGDLADRSMGISMIRAVLTGVVMSGVLNLAFSLVYFGLLFYYDVGLALLACGIFLVLALVTSFSAVTQTRYQRRYFEVRGAIAGFVFQLVSGLSRIRVAGAENRALAAWTRKFTTQRRLTFRTRWLTNNLAALNALLPALATIALFAAFFLKARQDLSLGSFLAFNVAFSQVLAAAVTVSSMIAQVASVIPLQERCKSIIETPPEVDLDKAQVGALGGEIEISHVSFRYQPDGPLILNDVNVHIRPGEFVAFVGPSGAGKSTIIRMLLGFDKPASGSIYYDRLDLAGLDLQAVRHQMGVVQQDGKLMAGDILTNITGSGRFTEEDAWQAAALSGLDEDIKQMPLGMYTSIGEGGSTLSGGQRQRLMIARAIVSKPAVLIFDEATSALDNETQAKVSASLERLQSTRVVVAHRLSTIVRADRIIVLDQGRIVQTGTYQELMQQPGLFAELAQRQLA
jgi:NHLM bacteriocin system ABC transporter ATP-binding protein